MPHRQLIEFECDTCHQIVKVDVTDGEQYSSSWPLGWVIITAQVVGLDEREEKVYCDQHANPIAQALGYPSAAMLGVVLAAMEDAKANEAEKQEIRMLRKKHGDVIESEDGITLLSDEDDED